MKSLLIAMAALPLMVGAASAATPLSDGQLDQVNAGFGFGLAIANASAWGRNPVTFTYTNVEVSSHSSESTSVSAAFVSGGHH
jgi:hypothetical protein